ncbi:DJ-1/PfpI family protein [Micromonospora sp. WMMD712]|uniref:DJ-1/PfpI family protein n=1 Tax=Micromonospora sp. WMMD712 TaxID=3016096 RepID=UPI00249B16CF|nr:DJ-1/PfpI family protein [Micromonospora sp. WMMD712]WFE61293.1 DJ-1/PfpI family protein [Micromonospora sp. WMMD712]
MLVQMVLFDGFDPLDVVGPFEVLAAGGDAVAGVTAGGPAAGDRAAAGALDVELVTAEGPREVVSGTRGLTLRATARLRPDRPGYVVVPGASGPVSGDPDQGVQTIPVLLARFAESAAPLMRTALDNPDVTVATVCGGSLALAMAGLIEGRHAVTHHLGMDVLEATGVHAVRARIVDDGDLISAGGVTSGLDLGLYLLEREFGPRIAHAVETLFEHERRGVVWRATGRTPIAV